MANTTRIQSSRRLAKRKREKIFVYLTNRPSSLGIVDDYDYYHYYPFLDTFYRNMHIIVRSDSFFK
jgi:hypothetical protein